jgi:hypothetical protein
MARRKRGQRETGMEILMRDRLLACLLIAVY